MICESQINHKFLTKNLDEMKTKNKIKRNLDRVSIPNKKLGSTCLSLSIRPERLLSDYGPSIYYVSKEVGGWGSEEWQSVLIYSSIYADVDEWVGPKKDQNILT